MNTVGKPGQLGSSIRCVVSVSMLTEGWDANTVTHILGIRAFGMQLLCEQVIGRALRRLIYELNEEGLFVVEYADIFGIPFDFTAKPVVAPPQPPKEVVQVKAVRPEHDLLEITFPRVEGYRVELSEERLAADFNADSVLVLSPDLMGPSITRNAGIIGEAEDLRLVVEIKGYRGQDAVEKKLTMDAYRVPGVNHLGAYGRWAFAEFTEVYEIETDFAARVENQFNQMIDGFTPGSQSTTSAVVGVPKRD